MAARTCAAPDEALVSMPLVAAPESTRYATSFLFSCFLVGHVQHPQHGASMQRPFLFWMTVSPLSGK